MPIIKANGRPVFVVITGLPGAGKSTLLTNLRVSHGDQMTAPVVHSSDALREEIYGDAAVQGDNSVLFAELYRRICADLRRGKDVVLDATSLTQKVRANALRQVAGCSCTPVAVFLNTNVETCLKRNQMRDRHVPETVIRRMASYMTPPSVSEGFADVIIC